MFCNEYPINIKLMKQATYPPFAGLILIGTLCWLLGGCGIQTELPSTPATPTEKAVKVSRVRYTNDGVQITCQINDVLVGPDIPLVLFIEFEGDMIQSIPIQNTATHEFNNFVLNRDGNVLCVVVYAEAEFASESVFLDSSSP